MKAYVLILASLALFATNIDAKELRFDDLNTADRQAVADMVFEGMNHQGAFGNADADSLNYAKEVVRTIVADQDLFNRVTHGDLKLEEFVADYFLKDTITGAIDIIKDIGSKVIKTIKELASSIASIANTVLTAVTDSKTLMKTIEVSVGVANKLIPFGANALGLALLTVPGAEVLIPVIAAATPILQKVVTPTNVTKALEIAASSAKLADQYLNPAAAAAALAPRSDLLALEAKAKNPASRKEAGEGVQLALKGSRAIQKYIASMSSAEWRKLPASTRQKLLDAVNKVNKVTGLLNTKKL